MSKYAVNLLALPKEPKIMKCFVAPKGSILGQFDVAGLEPHVLAYYSQDPTLLKVYGKDAWPHHDIYFVAGMSIPVIGDQIKEHYSLDTPTLEGLQLIKSELSDVRKKKLKPGFLGWAYYIGKYTLATNLNVTVDEADKILKGLNKQFPGRAWLHNRLTSEWAKNGGYVISGRGLPVCMDYSKKKDIVNRFIQTTGHDLLVRLMWHFNNHRQRGKNNIRPYIPDYHDESIWAITKGHEDEFIDATAYAFDRLNDELNWDGIEFKHGGINFGNTLEVRCDD